MLTNTEAAQLEADLVTARDQQQSGVGIKPQPKKDQKAAGQGRPGFQPGSIY